MKNQLNNQKSRQNRGKIIKSSVTFNENKPNLSEDKFGVSPLEISKYEILPAWRGKKQTQFKANSNPIPESPKMNLRNAITMNYEISPVYRTKKTNPIKPKSNPKQIYPRMSQSGTQWDLKMLVLDFSDIRGILLVSEQISHCFSGSNFMTQQTDLIGYCGLYCGDCAGYTQTVANLARDLRAELRRHRFGRMAPALAKVPIFKEFKDYDKCYNLLGTMVKMRCNKTCRGNGGPPGCRARQCCRKKNIKGCWECGDFAACEKLKFLEQHHGKAHLKNLRKIKKQGPKAFVIGKRYWYAAR